VNEVNQSKPW